VQAANLECNILTDLFLARCRVSPGQRLRHDHRAPVGNASPVYFFEDFEGAKRVVLRRV
jgi:hypothetical protein